MQSTSNPTPQPLNYETEELEDAARALEEIIAHLPGETRESILVLAEEHGLTWPVAGLALKVLEDHGRIRSRRDSEGDEVWELATGELGGPSSIHSPDAPKGILCVYSRNDVAEQRWRLIPDWVWCPLCGPVRVK